MRVVRVGYLPYDYFTEVTLHKNGTIEVRGIEINLLNILAESLNFKYKLVPSLDEEWGRRLANGNWTGIIGMVARKEVDIGLGYLSQAAGRTEAVDFTEPYWSDEITFVTSRPAELRGLNTFVSPFSSEVWLLLLLSLLLTLSVYSFQAAVHSKSIRATLRTFLSILNYMTGLLLRQGVQQLKFLKTTKARFLLHLWLIASAILSAAYCGVLLSFMVSPVTGRPIHTIEDLLWAVEKKGYSLAFEPGSIHHNLLEKPDNFKVYAALNKVTSKDKRLTCKNMDEAADLLLGNQVVFMEARLPVMFKIYEKGVEKFTLGREPVHDIKTAIAIKKNFELKHHFNKIIKKINGAGLVSKWVKEEWTKLSFRSRQQESSDSSFLRPLSFADLKYAFVLVIYFHLAAFVIFVLEILLNCRRKIKIFCL